MCAHTHINAHSHSHSLQKNLFSRSLLRVRVSTKDRKELGLFTAVPVQPVSRENPICGRRTGLIHKASILRSERSEFQINPCSEAEVILL